MKGKELRAFLRVAEGAQDEKRAQPASERAPPPVFFVTVADKGLMLDEACKGDE